MSGNVTCQPREIRQWTNNWSKMPQKEQRKTCAMRNTWEGIGVLARLFIWVVRANFGTYHKPSHSKQYCTTFYHREYVSSKQYTILKQYLNIRFWQISPSSNCHWTMHTRVNFIAPIVPQPSERSSSHWQLADQFTEVHNSLFLRYCQQINSRNYV